MKKVGELMKEAGFNSHASTSVKEAFIKHLIKASTGMNVQTPSEKKEIAENPQKVLQLKGTQQLSFDFGDEKIVVDKTNKKASTF